MKGYKVYGLESSGCIFAASPELFLTKEEAQAEVGELLAKVDEFCIYKMGDGEEIIYPTYWAHGVTVTEEPDGTTRTTMDFDQ